jgi:hypothetical protein
LVCRPYALFLEKVVKDTVKTGKIKEAFFVQGIQNKLLNFSDFKNKYLNMKLSMSSVKC